MMVGYYLYAKIWVSLELTTVSIPLQTSLFISLLCARLT